MTNLPGMQSESLRCKTAAMTWLDRIALLHPLVPWEPAPAPALAGIKVLITAGQNAPIGPWPLTERLINWSRVQGAEVTTEVHAGGHELRQSEVAVLGDFLGQPVARTGEIASAMRGA